MNKLLTILSLILFSGILSAQHDCATDLIFQNKLTNNAEFNRRVEELERAYYLSQTDDEFSYRVDNDQVLTIPVVVHVMHKGEEIGTGSNISEENIIKGIRHLNRAFANIDGFATGPNHTNSGVEGINTNIQFCLAVQDPDGNPTTGVTRQQSQYSDLNFREPCGDSDQDYCLKSSSIWDTKRYMNVWLVNSICVTENTNCGVAGYSTLGASHGSDDDGMVVESRFWGSTPANSRIHIHEVGHYLNLYHTFQGGCEETDCLIGGDRVCDTPPDNSTTGVDCYNGVRVNTCTNDAEIFNTPFTSDVEDMYENYMDYGVQACQNTFTPGQRDRMRLCLTTTRASLLSSNGCNSVGIPPSAGFILNSYDICKGKAIEFSGVSNGEVTSWNWSFPGGSPSSSTEEKPTVTYNEPGSYSATLTVSNSFGQATQTKNDIVTINEVSRESEPKTTNNSTSLYYNFGISYVVLEQIVNATNKNYESGTAYEDFACSDMVAELTIGNEYSLSVIAGRDNAADNVKVWIDFDGNGILDPVAELVYNAASQNVLVTRNFTVPESVSSFTNDDNIQLNALGTTVTDKNVLMRVISEPGNGTDFITPTYEPEYGQVEDYAILIKNKDVSFPLEWLSFDANSQNGNVDINWKTINEVNTDYFEIQRFSNGNQFEIIGSVKANNTLTQNEYSYTDLRTEPNNTYHYRLKQVDFDGAYTYSNIISTHVYENNKYVSVYPNPTNGQFSIRGLRKEDVKSIDVINVLGQNIITTSMLNIDLSNHQAGIYLVSISKKNGQNIKMKLIKN